MRNQNTSEVLQLLNCLVTYLSLYNRMLRTLLHQKMVGIQYTTITITGLFLNYFPQNHFRCH